MCAKYGTKCVYGTVPFANNPPSTDRLVLLKRLQLKTRELEARLAQGPSPSNSSTQKSPTNSVSSTSTTSSAIPSKRLSVASLIHDDSVSNVADEDDHDMVISPQVYNCSRNDAGPRNGHFGPWTSDSILRADPILSKVYMSFNNTSGKDKLMSSLNSHETGDYRGSLSLEQKYDELGEYESIRMMKDQSDIAILSKKNLFNEKAKLFGLSFFEGDIRGTRKLLTKIKMVLPKKKVVWMLLDRFFSNLVPFFGIVDEFECISNFERIIGPRSLKDEPIHTLNMQQKLDFAYVGMLLVFLRLTYLSLFSNIRAVNEQNIYSASTSQAAQDLKYLMTNPVNWEVSNVAQMCLNLFNLVNSSNLVVLQLATLIRYYQIYGPEYGDEPNSSEPQVFSALLMQMAYSLGLHREPDKFPDGNKNERMNHVGRKLWHLLYILDVSSALVTGYSSTGSNFSVDVKFPYLNDRNANFKDLKVERVILNSMDGVTSYKQPLQKVFSAVSNVNEKFSMRDISNTLGECMNLLTESRTQHARAAFFPDRESWEISTYYFKTFKIKYLCQMGGANMALNFHFSNYCYSIGKDEVALEYLHKSLKVFYEQFHTVMETSVINDKPIFENVNELITTPSIHSFIYLASVINLSLLTKVEMLLDQPQELSDLRPNLFVLKSLLSRALDVLLNFLSVLGNRYYTPWKNSKVLSLLLTEVRKPTFCSTFGTAVPPNGYGLTNENTTRLITMISKSMSNRSSLMASEFMNVMPENTDALWLLIIALSKNESEHQQHSPLDCSIAESALDIGEDTVFDSCLDAGSSGFYIDEIFKDFFPSSI
ncbi:hypothetical protein CANTEDRAFT_135205 [Yamadazyma tenuis ATCC 10573]|uniref:Xylanolytic transcriptional activator regulatory domain-containing protein n=1 Tax=Candida tenuis (strain ATCC 10573 / BCRC 21748 / CBS 615 / JCM 9827 / NBRC 10315 / NRRL Y-1498 / VKM Y-70) TaxID=590646 RepID=G3B654_CANTC|nr:uncharacterized protein CANTEDRAFT_135205 [Yamadazyma tenuis ATCC 10573]EGV63385.1 hypothetical protein CANTEDRAFT_135205 [Yamadazyma tenuis ATCC 10573]